MDGGSFPRDIARHVVADFCEGSVALSGNTFAGLYLGF